MACEPCIDARADLGARLGREDPVAGAVIAGIAITGGTAGLALTAGATSEVTGTALVANFSQHAAGRMAERGITPRMVDAAQRLGETFLDPKNKSVVKVIKGGFASGRDLLVGTRPGQPNLITTAIRGFKLAAKRFIPFR